MAITMINKQHEIGGGHHLARELIHIKKLFFPELAIHEL